METAREPSHSALAASRAWYGAAIADFLQSTPESVFACLASNPEFALLTTQEGAWLAQIDLLRQRLVGLEGSLFLEFNIPRMGRRIDAVLLVGSVVFVIEFKVGETAFNRAAFDQVWDYALDLKNFHAASHVVALVPILLPTPMTDGAWLARMRTAIGAQKRAQWALVGASSCEWARSMSSGGSSHFCEPTSKARPRRHACALSSSTAPSTTKFQPVGSTIDRRTINAKPHDDRGASLGASHGFVPLPYRNVCRSVYRRRSGHVVNFIYRSPSALSSIATTNGGDASDSARYRASS